MSADILLISSTKLGTESSTFYKNFTNIKRVEPELHLPTDINSEDRITLHIQFIIKLLNDMNDSTTAIFTDGSSLVNPGPTGAGSVVFRAGINEPPIKTVSSNSTNYYGEIDVVLLALKHISSTHSEVSTHTINIFSHSIVVTDAIKSLSTQEGNLDKIEKIIHISSLPKCFSFKITFPSQYTVV